MIKILKELHIIAEPKHKWLFRLFGMINVDPEKATFATQNKDEEIVIILRRHIINNLPWMITTLFLFFLPFILYLIFSLYDHNFNNDSLTQGGIIQGIDPAYVWSVLIFYLLIIVSYAYFKFIHWYFDLFIITNERYISIDFNILKGRAITDIPLTDIIDISERVFGFFPTIFGYGNIEFKTTSEKLSLIESVPQTVWIRDSLSDLIRYIRKVKVVKSIENPKLDLVINDKREIIEMEKEKGKKIETMKPAMITDIVGGFMANKEKKNNRELINKNRVKEP